MAVRYWKYPLLALGFVVSAKVASAEILFLGFDTQSPVQMYSTTGTFLGNFGQGAATGSALDGAGHVWTVAPAFGNNQIVEYDAKQNVLNSFTATINGGWIEDMAFGGSNQLWVSNTAGTIFNINATTGAVNSSFQTLSGNIFGVAFDGTHLWTTSGFEGNGDIYEYSTGGTLINTLQTGKTNLGGIGYDAVNNSLWVGTFGTVYDFSLTGTLESSFTAGSAFHDGLEVGNLNAVPEPATWVMLLAGFAGLAFAGYRTRRSSISIA